MLSERHVQRGPDLRKQHLRRSGRGRFWKHKLRIVQLRVVFDFERQLRGVDGKLGLQYRRFDKLG